jgi:hypothetical protein
MGQGRALEHAKTLAGDTRAGKALGPRRPRCCFGATPLVGELPRSNGQTTAWPSAPSRALRVIKEVNAGRGDPPDIPQRLRAASADGLGRSWIIAQAQRPAVRLDDRDGADDRGIHSQYRGIRSARRRRSGELRQATAQTRGHSAISAAFRGRRRRALCRQSAGKGAVSTDLGRPTKHGLNTIRWSKLQYPQADTIQTRPTEIQTRYLGGFRHAPSVWGGASLDRIQLNAHRF